MTALEWSELERSRLDGGQRSYDSTGNGQLQQQQQPLD